MHRRERATGHFARSIELPTEIDPDAADVHIELREGMLILDAIPRHDSPESWRPVYREYESGGFHREFGIWDEIDRDAIEARIRNGVLELVLPEARHHTPRRIEVQGL